VDNEQQVVVRFKDLEVDVETKEVLEKRCLHIGEEFKEVASFELTLSPESDDVSAHAHAVGKNTRTASKASGPDARVAGDRALDKLERELRTDHDKRIFAPRREAQRQRRRTP